ncbi:hypothetical protein BGZ70_008544 [Mortierella alpina]|uniref:Uncharacterized protein n=1 Tax=Mortierella alpina TaxID=64518 RepID=A0A9P6M1M2_MORAP|nr:hypothetical protein BGZ70_008544 [Mortierella alpina]
MNASKRDSKAPQTTNTRSSIVSNLVRAAIGGNHAHVPDQDLDKYVADMIMKSANHAHEDYKKKGLDAYTSPASSSSSSENKVKLASGAVISREDSNGLKTNKRFLSSIIKSTDDHNQALIRAEEKRATELAKELIADLDKKAAERRKQQRGRDRGRDRGRKSQKNKPSEASSQKTAALLPCEDRTTHSRSRSRSPGAQASRDTVVVRGRGSRKYDSRSPVSASPSMSPSRSRLGSKMDKYFQEGYDPLLDNHSGDDMPATTTSKSKSKRKSKSKTKEKKSRRDRSDKDQKRHKKRHRSEERRDAKKRRQAQQKLQSESVQESKSDSESIEAPSPFENQQETQGRSAQQACFQ